MQNHQSYIKTDYTGWQKCFCCGAGFRLLGIPFSSSQTSIRALTQQRAYQCSNCGHMVCGDCSLTDVHCVCQTNAWIARSVLVRKRHAPIRFLTINCPDEPREPKVCQHISDPS